MLAYPILTALDPEEFKILRGKPTLGSLLLISSGLTFILIGKTSFMIEHLVLFKWKENTSTTQIAEVLSALAELKTQIPGIIDLVCGENFSDRSQGFETGLVVRFVDRNALEVYQPHPAHQEVVQTLIKPIVADILALDFEHSI